MLSDSTFLLLLLLFTTSIINKSRKLIIVHVYVNFYIQWAVSRIFYSNKKKASQIDLEPASDSTSSHHLYLTAKPV